jgi:hypothetical protein
MIEGGKLLKIKTGNFLFLLIYVVIFALKMLDRFKYITMGNYIDFILYGLLLILGIVFSFKNLGSGKSFINIRGMSKGKVFKSILLGLLIGFLSVVVIDKFSLDSSSLIGNYKSLVLGIPFMIVFALGSEIFFRGFLLGLYKTKDRFFGVIFAALLYGITFNGLGNSVYYFVLAIFLSMVVISSKSIINNIIIMLINLSIITMYDLNVFDAGIEKLIVNLYSLGFLAYIIIGFAILLLVILIVSYKERANDYTRITGDEGFLGRNKESILTWHLFVVFILFIIGKVDIFIK